MAKQPEGDCYPLGGGGSGSQAKKVRMADMATGGARKGKGKGHVMKGGGAGSQKRVIRQTSMANHEEMVMDGCGYMTKRLSKKGRY